MAAYNHPISQLRMTIVLVGLMGAGKTSVGKRLAELLEVPFQDSDDEVVLASSLEIPEIFERYGEAEFRRLERTVIARLLGGGACVLATGGGAFLDAETRKTISQAAVSVWINPSLETLWSRVEGRSGRPLLETENPKDALKKLYEDRAPFYQTADVTIPSLRDEPHEAVALRIVEHLRARDQDLPAARQIFQGAL